MKRRPKSSYDRSYDYERPPSPKQTSPRSFFNFSLNYATLALLGGILIAGIGIGIAFNTTASFSTENVASREIIDRSAPNAELCQQYGASAIVTDMKVYVTLNPFKVFVTKPVMQPGCVLRQNNWAILEQQKLVSHQQVSECKNRMNTFGFTGSLESSSPEITCIYPNDDAGNHFVNKPGTAIPRTGPDNF
ncbi:DUF3172 domain-containing protein [Lusitaniella coriacea LEGE 07157]|uniref:DUF3172 domain-containing protein n=1 Tax=Lusitaniella coriacea LEGE 07157 TaxID=945747 RepID=A0A8J7DZE7_9CYAN|nr:DUF3172 domain-containing protein [Lusitaniella coriacea]MBE9117288.1 DUF3172 domain-containing protein [Lusitaniella coriacea LEGE 07157]